MEAILKISTRVLIAGGLVAAVATPLALADTGSDLFNAEVAQVQQTVLLRNQLADDLVQSQLALGYSVPESLESQTMIMQTQANGDAFGRAMQNLHRSMLMYAGIEERW
jgi:hypothetical protein